ncbi:MAG: macro domain-containing protein [Chloroflexi bacterium]|nr:macro domain-containing protein [Chloroflexota bacterium]
MTITYVVGDLFESPAQVLVNTVNTVGVMGKGIALDFKLIYPDMFKKYQSLCEQGLFNVGQLWLYKTPYKWVLNFPTKKHWRNPSNPEYIRLGLEKFAATYLEKGITSISFPMLGCGNGELDWDSQVRPMMEQYLRDLPIDCYIHVYPRGAGVQPEHRDIARMKRWLNSEPQSLPFDEVWTDLRQILAKQEKYRSSVTGRVFAVTFTDAGDETIFRPSPNGEGEFSVTYDRWLALWQHLRSAGYIMAQHLPGELREASDYVVTLMSELEYVKPIRLSRRDVDNERELGLQLIPGASAEKDREPIEVREPA